jgi:DNA adenine methylase
MQYHGGKARQAKRIGAYLKTLGNGRYYEPFVGGGSVLAQVAEHFNEVYASDIHPDLILMYQALQQGWVPPTEVSEAEYQRLRYAEPSALRGFVGFACSFGGKWFGGYARGGTPNYAHTGVDSLMRKATHIRTATFRCRDYRQLSPAARDVIYCDPPYAKGAQLTQSRGFDSGLFWGTMAQWSKAGAIVVVSESQAPDGWQTVMDTSSVLSLGVYNDKVVRTEHLLVMA